MLILFIVSVKSDSIDSILDEIDWSAPSASSNYGGFSSLSSEYIVDNGYYENQASAPFDDHDKRTLFNDDGNFIVPVGVHKIDGWVATVAQEFSFQIEVSANQAIAVDFEKELCGGEGGVSISVNNEQKVYVPGINDCGTNELYYGDGIIAPESYATLGNHWVSFRYNNTCPEHFTNLKTDFNPLLLPDSSLYIVDGEPVVRVNFQLPAYYYDISAEYKDGQCNSLPSLSSLVDENDGCLMNYKTSINYVNECPGFIVDENASNANNTETGYSYSGKLTVSAKLDLNVAGFMITRSVDSPINWRVFIQKTIEVSSDVEVKNDNICTTEAECNNNGCCVDGTFCDCNCAEFGNGYIGTYCEEDNQPPTCDLGHKEITLESPHGGCIFATNEFINNQPNFNDNSGNTYVIRNFTLADGTKQALTNQFPEDNSDLHELCLDIGTHHIIWHVQDTPLYDPHTENEHAFCSLKINVIDKGAPFIDCASCQTTDLDHVDICISAKDDELFTKIQIDVEDLHDYFNDNYLSDNDVVYPGDNYNGNHLDCDCQIQRGNAPPVSVITNTWGSWENLNGVRTFDVHDLNPTADYPVDEQEDDGIYPLTYKSTDEAGNVYTCNIGVTFDATPPTCTDYIDENVAVDENNKNYSVVVNFDEIPVHDATISGKDQGPVMTPQRTSGDVYHVGYAYNATYESIWWITDLAGNNGTCTWRIIVQNPEPCIYPVCDDLPPYIYDNSCPDNIDIHCHENSNCGCGDFTPPSFRDDKFVKEIKVFVDDELFETYNNDESSTLPSESLKIGTSNIRYTAFDMHGQHVHCNFTITIRDQAAPYETTDFPCPEDETIDTDLSQYNYNYNFQFTDDCSLNENIAYTGGLVGVQSSGYYVLNKKSTWFR